MSKSQHKRAKAVFLEVLDLPHRERAAAIARNCGGDSVVQQEVESLLRVDEEGGKDERGQGQPGADEARDERASISLGQRIYAPVHIARDTLSSAGFPRALRQIVQHRFFLAIPIVLLMGMVGGGLAVRNAIQRTLEDEIRGHLRSVLDSNYLAIDLWSAHRFEEATRWADDPHLAELLEHLERIARTSPDDREARLSAAPEQAELKRMIAVGLRASQYERTGALDLDYTLISSSVPAQIGKTLDPDGEIAAAVLKLRAGKPAFIARRLVGYSFPESDRTDTYFSWFTVPIRNAKGAVFAGMLFGVDVADNFDKVLQAGRWGKSGETYAFDARGRMVSPSRFESSLHTAGLLKPNGARSPYVEIRDPGGDVTEGYRGDTPPAGTPYTHIVAAALDALNDPARGVRGGEITESYRDYRGIEVLGAWRWNPVLDVGLVTEIDAAEALATMRFINRVFATLVGLAALGATAAIGAFAFAMRLRPTARLGARMGQYKLIRKVGEGGIGEVYLASHELLKRPTAIKFLKAESEDGEALSRFEREVRATSRLTHPNTVAIYDFGRTADGRFYYAMEFLVGISLARLLEIEPRMPLNRAIHIVCQVAASLKEAHLAGLVHRDVKPLNIMACRVGGEYDIAKVVDFGLVKNLKTVDPKERTQSTPTYVRGTPAYLAPERLDGSETVDGRADIYSLGVVMYKMLAGVNPFQAAHDMGILFDILHVKPRPLAELCPELPPAMSELIMTCLEKRPGDRPADMDSVLQKLRAVRVTPWTRDDAARWWATRDHLLPVVLS